ncbi:Protein tyrosine phosphatase type IVA 1 [Rhizopus stolonifer]|uniref:protein-tyrosine-phosphatase n=1 Tax=Rhizopus stolonifer TaxID=4846 RepID=A0A367KNP8_RHIST|nr:Protein tyrosine phosphatase type IVA 1 [Rhizopus stolonifer]
MVATSNVALHQKRPCHHGHHSKHVNTPLSHTLSLIEHPSSPIRFLILDCPTESTLSFYMEEFKNLDVSTVVRCCQPTYSSEALLQNGISVVDLPFKDGGIPPPHVVHEWLHVIEEAKTKSVQYQQSLTIAVHCVAGLGRAPVLVAIALIELGMASLDAIEYIRDKRRGAFNKPQIAFLDGYRRKPTGSQYSLRVSLGRMFGFGPKTTIVSQQT